MGTTLTAVVVDQWGLVALGVSAVLAELGVETVATHSDARLGVRAVREHKADLFVLGATATSSVEAVRHATRLTNRPAVIALVTGADHTELGQLIAEGTDALVVRSATGDELTHAIGRVRNGERYIAPALLSSLVGAVAPVPASEAATELLTTREREVLACLAQGRTNREIAQDLYVGTETVKSHLSKVYAKLDARDRHEAVARALAAGLLG